MHLSLSPWYDTAATLEDVRGMLRLQIGDVDEDRIGACIPAIAALIDARLDRCDLLPGPPPPAPVQYALNHGVVRMYLDTPTQPAEGTLIVPGFPDPLADVDVYLTPYKQRWGWA